MAWDAVPVIKPNFLTLLHLPNMAWNTVHVDTSMLPHASGPPKETSNTMPVKKSMLPDAPNEWQANFHLMLVLIRAPLWMHSKLWMGLGKARQSRSEDRFLFDLAGEPADIL